MLHCRLFWVAIYALCFCLIGAEPQDGPANDSTRANGNERAPRAAVNSATALPWPEPDKTETDKLTAELREQLPMDVFKITRIGPWIVATDLDPAETEHFTKYAIGRYAAAIQQQLFTAHPRTQPVKVFLFKNKLSYETWNKKLFDEKPISPFGYYSRAKKALVMNIGTGGGTLLHEMVHAMAEADFGKIPAWLNEGLGSLFEASSYDASGKVVGVTNWRLTGLQESLKAGAETKFKDLLAFKDDEFYGEHSGTHYASMRYLMQWLQLKGKLSAFYMRVRDKNEDGPTALKAVFEYKQSVDEIEHECYEWVRTLVLQ